MPRYHVSPRTGNAVVCKAKVRCPFGDLQRDHYSSREEALAAYEERMKKSLLPSFDRGEMVVEALPPSLRVDDDTVVLPRGMYVLGDPSFILGEDAKAWGDWIEVVSQEEGGFYRGAVGALVNNYPVVSLPVQAGPGAYADSFNRKFDVPSQQFAALPLPLVKKMGLQVDDLLDYAVVVSFEKPTKLQGDPQGGILAFGDHLLVNGGEQVDVQPDPSLYLPEAEEEDYYAEEATASPADSPVAEEDGLVPTTPYYEQP